MYGYIAQTIDGYTCYSSCYVQSIDKYQHKVVQHDFASCHTPNTGRI